MAKFWNSVLCYRLKLWIPAGRAPHTYTHSHTVEREADCNDMPAKVRAFSHPSGLLPLTTAYGGVSKELIWVLQLRESGMGVCVRESVCGSAFLSPERAWSCLRPWVDRSLYTVPSLSLRRVLLLCSSCCSWSVPREIPTDQDVWSLYSVSSPWPLKESQSTTFPIRMKKESERKRRTKRQKEDSGV